MLLDQVTIMPGEGSVLVEGTVTDTLRRLREGDAILGWEGDPNMQLFADLETGLYDVWTLDKRGEPVLVAAQRPYADQRLIEDVVRADTRRFDVLARVQARRVELERDEARKRRDQREELADKLHLALLKDAGHLFAGQTRRVY